MHFSCAIKCESLFIYEGKTRVLFVWVSVGFLGNVVEYNTIGSIREKGGFSEHSGGATCDNQKSPYNFKTQIFLSCMNIGIQRGIFSIK